MGNPHLVTFVEDITQINLPEIGPQLENQAPVPQAWVIPEPLSQTLIRMVSLPTI